MLNLTRLSLAAIVSTLLIACGGLGVAFNKGVFLDFSRNSLAHNDVYVSLAHGLGLTDVTTFGKPSLVRGPIPDLMG